MSKNLYADKNKRQRSIFNPKMLLDRYQTLILMHEQMSIFAKKRYLNSYCRGVIPQHNKILIWIDGEVSHPYSPNDRGAYIWNKD